MSAGEFLDQLDEVRAAATPGPWAQNGADPAYVIGEVSDDGEEYLDVADAGASVRPGDGWRKAEADAALIVAAVNALPQLTAAVRQVLAYCDEMDQADFFPGLAGTDAIRTRITSALGQAQPQSGDRP